MKPAGPAQQVEVGILLYDDCQISTVHGLSDLLEIASRFSLERGGPAVRVTQWGRQANGEIARCSESRPGTDGFPDTFFVAGRMSGPAGPEEAAP